MILTTFLLASLTSIAPPSIVGGARLTAIRQTYYAKTSPFLSAGAARAKQSQANLIHVEVGGLRNSKGQVVCALYSSADGFPKNRDKALAQTKSPISNAQAVCEFPTSNQAPTPFPSSTTKTPTANWTQTLWECPVKASALPITQKAISARQDSKLPRSASPAPASN